MIGYTKDLFILPFDHRGSFLKNMFGIENREASEEEIQKIKKAKEIIYQGFKKALLEDLPKETAAILVDEEFGDEILRDAKDRGFITLLTVEKSGQEEFDFEYGAAFAEHIEKYNPTFVKALVRYNPESGRDANSIQLGKLKRLSDFCHQKGYKFLVELIIVGGFEESDHARLVSESIAKFQNHGVEPDVWKLEGLPQTKDYEMVVKQAKTDSRADVGVVILGRAAEGSVVENWLKAGAKVPGVIGFAIGRTIFWNPIMQFEEGKMSEDEASEVISKRFLHYYHIFIEARGGL